MSRLRGDLIAVQWHSSVAARSPRNKVTRADPFNYVCNFRRPCGATWSTSAEATCQPERQQQFERRNLFVAHIPYVVSNHSLVFLARLCPPSAFRRSCNQSVPLSVVPDNSAWPSRLLP